MAALDKDVQTLGIAAAVVGIGAVLLYLAVGRPSGPPGAAPRPPSRARAQSRKSLKVRGLAIRPGLRPALRLSPQQAARRAMAPDDGGADSPGISPFDARQPASMRPRLPPAMIAPQPGPEPPAEPEGPSPLPFDPSEPEGPEEPEPDDEGWDEDEEEGTDEEFPSDT